MSAKKIMSVFNFAVPYSLVCCNILLELDIFRELQLIHENVKLSINILLSRVQAKGDVLVERNVNKVTKVTIQCGAPRR